MTVWRDGTDDGIDGFVSVLLGDIHPDTVNHTAIYGGML
jgi:hypothetical protein